MTYVEVFDSSDVEFSFREGTMSDSNTQIHTFQVLQISNSIVIVIQHLHLETSPEYQWLLSAERETASVLE